MGRRKVHAGHYTHNGTFRMLTWVNRAAPAATPGATDAGRGYAALASDATPAGDAAANSCASFDR